MTDLTTLERLAAKLDEDANRLYGINPAAMRSVASIIREAIGAPVSWPSRVAGCDAAAEAYPGNPALRLAFNAGVKWAVERYSPTTEPVNRYRHAEDKP